MSFSLATETTAWAQTSRLQCFHHTNISSTNDWAKENAFSDELKDSGIALVVAEHQSQGRGRGDHVWNDIESSQHIGGALLSSWLFQLGGLPKPVTSCRIGLAVERAISGSWPWLDVSLKAPNDIYLGERKLAGILIENLQQGEENRLIVGLGLNVFTKPQLPAEAPQAVCLSDQLATDFLTQVEWRGFLDRLFLELTMAVSHSSANLSASEQKAILFALNKKPHLLAKYLAVEADGSLILEHGQNTRRVHWLEL